MKTKLVRPLLIFAMLLTGAGAANAAQALLVEGKYQSKNLYVQNALNDGGIGYCVYEVRVNGQVSTDEVNSSAFEIDLRNFNLKPGDQVEVQLFHKDGCSPKVLNPEALKPRPTFNTESISITPGGLLTWSTTGETGSLTYIIEQYRWNKWVYVGEIQGVGTAVKNNYSFQTTPHSGENRFRVKQLGFGREVRYTPEVKFTSTIEAVTYTQSKDSKQIMLSAQTLYEMYDPYGNVVLKGYGSSINIAQFGPGEYFLCYDNKMTPISRKK
ncbi:MAG: hypothetical protein MUC87_18730 [Bacteroidia bacterium]|nr:hypothetical protein [Bacteroidia bacterium]